MKAAVKTIKCSVCKTRFTPKYSTLEKCSKGCELEYKKRKSNGKESKKGNYNYRTSLETECEYFEPKNEKVDGNIVWRDGLSFLEYKPNRDKRKPIKRISKEQAKANREIARIKEELIREHGEICQSCGKYGEVDASHLIARSQRKDLETNKLNVTLKCRICHNWYTVNNFFKIRLFLNYEEIMERIK